MSSLRKNPNQSYQELLRSIRRVYTRIMSSLFFSRGQSFSDEKEFFVFFLFDGNRKILHDKYSQKPQLSTSHRIVSLSLIGSCLKLFFPTC